VSPKDKLAKQHFAISKKSFGGAMGVKMGIGSTSTSTIQKALAFS